MEVTSPRNEDQPGQAAKQADSARQSSTGAAVPAPGEVASNTFFSPSSTDTALLSELETQIRRFGTLATLGRSLSGIAHELNNKLAPVLAFGELLQGSSLSDTDRRRVGRIVDAAEGARRVVESLLGFSRDVRAVRDFLNVNEVIHHTFEFIGYRIKSLGIRVHFDLDEDLPGTLADRHLLSQVFLNLFQNSIDALGDRGGSISIQSFHEDEWIYILFGDSGPGIRQELAEKIFDPFVSGEEKESGTGLGLHLCRKFLEDHGGDISLASSGRDSRFRIRIPIIDRRSAVRPESASQSAEQFDDKVRRILLIDDDVELAEGIGEALSEEFDVTRTARADEALELIKEYRFDAVVTDLRMPGMSGMDLYRRILQDRPEIAASFVFITGDMLDTYTRDFLEAVNRPALTKPFRPSELSKTVRILIRRNESSRTLAESTAAVAGAHP